jgi:hypothetical protein
MNNLYTIPVQKDNAMGEKHRSIFPYTKVSFPTVGIGNVTKLFKFVLYVDDHISYYDLTDILLLGVSFISCYCKKNSLKL